jgi:hypothetical protein
VVQEVNDKVASVEKRIAAALGKPITIKIDWDALLRSDQYTSAEDYVAFLREVSCTCERKRCATRC